MRIGFWNTGNNVTSQHLSAFVSDQRLDILSVAEGLETSDVVRGVLRKSTNQPFEVWSMPTDNVHVYAVHSRKFRRPVSSGSRYSILRVELPARVPFLLVYAHLRSKLRRRTEEQTLAAPVIAERIRQAEQKVGHRNTIVIGDLNMNPFEDGVVGASGFHAVSTRLAAKKSTRIVEGDEYPLFYNPMWSMMGDESRGAPGSYYNERSEMISMFWNTFDQALIRPSLLQYLPHNSVEIITTVGGSSLLTQKEIPDRAKFSDHLPIVLEVTI